MKHRLVAGSASTAKLKKEWQTDPSSLVTCSSSAQFFQITTVTHSPLLFAPERPHGVNLQPGDFAARELAKRGQIVINIADDKSSRHTANFRGTTGLRSSREHITRAAGERVFFQSVAEYPAYLIAAYDNVLLGCL